MKTFLTIQTGNAAVERSLSDNKNTVTAERSHLSEEAKIGLRRMKEAARDVGGAHLVETTDKAIQESMKRAHHEFKQEKPEKK